LNRPISAFIDRAHRNLPGITSIRSNISLCEMKGFSCLLVQGV
jgi:hypothetical protein